MKIGTKDFIAEYSKNFNGNTLDYGEIGRSLFDIQMVKRKET